MPMAEQWAGCHTPRHAIHIPWYPTLTSPLPSITHPCGVQVLSSHLEFPRTILPLDLDCNEAAALLARFTSHEQIRCACCVWGRKLPFGLLVLCCWHMHCLLPLHPLLLAPTCWWLYARVAPSPAILKCMLLLQPVASLSLSSVVGLPGLNLVENPPLPPQHPSTHHHPHPAPPSTHKHTCLAPGCMLCRAGQVLFERGEAADDIYILECGAVLCAVDYAVASVHSRAAERALPADVSMEHTER